MAPTGLSAAPNGQNEIDLSWNNPSQTATGYTVQRSTNGTDFSDVGSVGYADDTYFSDTTVAAGTQYWYQVLANDASAPSETATAVTDPAISLPDTNATTVNEGDTYTLATTNVFASGEVDPATGFTINWGDGNTTNASGLANGDPGSFPHVYTTTGFYTITASTIDGSFTGTQNVEATYNQSNNGIKVTSSDPNEDGSPSSPTGGVEYSLYATYADHAGHAATAWVINWGDGTLQTFGGGTFTPDTSGAGSTNTITFTHTYPVSEENPDYPNYPVTITAVTSENVYEWGRTLYVDGNGDWSSDTLTGLSNDRSDVPGGTIVDGASDAHVIAEGAAPGTFTVNWGDTTDGSDDTNYYDNTGAAYSPTHEYNRAGLYIVTISEAVDGGGTLSGREWLTVAANFTTMPTIPDQVVSEGQDMGLSESVTAASGDPQYATIEFENGTAPQVVPITDGVIDMTSVIAPSNFVDIEATYGIGTNVIAYNAAEAGKEGDQYFITDDWNVQLDNGESNDVLTASSDGTQNVQPVVFNAPHPAGVAYDITLTNSNPTDNVLWPNTSPATGATPLSGGTAGATYAYALSSTASSSATFGYAAINGDTIADAAQLTFSGVQNVSESTSGTTSASASVETQQASDMSVGIIADTNPNGATLTNNNVTGVARDWLVGQMVALHAAVTGPAGLRLSYSWSVPGDVLYSYTDNDKVATQTSLMPRNVQPAPAPFQVPGISSGLGTTRPGLEFFWVHTDGEVGSPDDDNVNLEVHGWSLLSGFLDANASTTFNVSEPDATMDVSHTETIKATPIHAGLVSTGILSSHGGIEIDGHVGIPATVSAAPGKWKFVQLANATVTRKAPGAPVPVITTTGGIFLLDTQDPYKFRVALPNKITEPYSTGSDETMQDSPSVPMSDGGVPVTQSAIAHEDFHTYLMFQPAGGTWVPVYEIDWHAYYTVTLNNILTLDSTITGASGPEPTSPAAALEEPLWSGNSKDHGFGTGD
jgi:hypothetical protein